jgi:pimeloyl-ACP methyl ester carboxylesterase
MGALPFALVICTSWLSVSISGARALLWGPCPVGDMGGGANQCAALSRPLDVDNPQSAGTVNIFLRRYFSGAESTSDTLWIVDGGPGFSAVELAWLAQAAVTLQPSVTAYIVDQRGVGLSGLINCANPPSSVWFDPNNATALAEYAACNADLISRYGSTAGFYSTYSWASDLVAAVNTVNPSRVAFFFFSYGTFVGNTYLQLPGARADVVLFDGAMPANRFVLENNAVWLSEVAMDLFSLCARTSSYCASRIGVAEGHLPRLVMDAIVDGTLPCLKQLPWLNQHRASVLAAGLTLSSATHSLAAPFWYRLYRCSPSDVVQLNYFNAFKESTDQAPQPPQYSYGLSVIISSNEFYSYAGGVGGPNGMSYSQQVNQTARLLADATPQTMAAFARDSGSGVPRYTPNAATAMKVAQPSVPLLITVGTLDANTPQGMGLWLANALGSNARLLTIPYATHGTVSPASPCVTNIALNFLLSFGAISAAGVDSSCLSTLSPPDFDGQLQATQQLSQTFFGTTDLWNAGGPIPTASPTPAPSTGSSNSGYVAAIVLLSASTVGLAAFSFILRRRLLTAAAHGDPGVAQVRDYSQL